MQKKVKYEQAIKTKYPEQVVIAIAKDRAGKANPITLGWTMIASGEPPMMAIAVAKTHYSIETITHSECFTIAFPSSEMSDAALFFGSKSGGASQIATSASSGIRTLRSKAQAWSGSSPRRYTSARKAVSRWMMLKWPCRGRRISSITASRGGR